jgi:hypothetical protein
MRHVRQGRKPARPEIAGGNPFEGARQNEYPNKPLIMSQAGLIFSKAAQSLAGAAGARVSGRP